MANTFDGIAVMRSKILCGILVSTEFGNTAKVRVADLANLKPQREKFPVGYGEFDVDSRKYYGFHVVIVKRGQQVIIEGRVTLRFFMKLSSLAQEIPLKLTSDQIWDYRERVCGFQGGKWHEYFTRRR